MGHYHSLSLVHNFLWAKFGKTRKYIHKKKLLKVSATSGSSEITISISEGFSASFKNSPSPTNVIFVCKFAFFWKTRFYFSLKGFIVRHIAFKITDRALFSSESD